MCRYKKKVTINKPRKNEVSLPIFTQEIQVWLKTMAVLLECANIIISFMKNMQNKFGFSEQGLKELNNLYIVLENTRQKLTLLDQKFTQSSSSNAVEAIIRSTSVETDTNGRMSKKFGLKYQRGSVSGRCSCAGRIISGEDFPNDDEHPYIIKATGELTFQENGVGYEIFYSMRRYPHVIAEYIEGTNEFQTFAELYRNSISAAIKLRAKGYNEDSIVCLCIPNNKYTCLPFIAGLFAGCVLNALDVSLGVSDITYLLTTVTPTIIFVQSEKIPDIKKALTLAKIDVEIVAVGAEIVGCDSIQDYLEASDEEIQNFRPYKVDNMKRTCVIFFSSGSSGLPKGICLSHLNILSQMALAVTFGYLNKVNLYYTSLYWITAVAFLLTSLLSGVTRVLPLEFNLNRLYKMIENYKINYMALTPPQCLMMTENPKPQDIDTSSLKCIIVGGSALSMTTCYALRKMFPECFVNQGYGMTEVAGIVARFAANNPGEIALCSARPSSSGQPFGGFWYKVVDENTGKILGPGQPGELCLKSRTSIMTGYYKKDSSDAFDDYGWLRTGDVIYYDDHNCIYNVDKVKELIKYRGWHITPNLLENILMTHPAVSRAVVVGIPHEGDDEHATGLILLRPEINRDTVDLNEIVEFVNNQVDERKWLRGGVRIIKSIPFTPTGKVRRRVLKEAIINGKDI